MSETRFDVFVRYLGTTKTRRSVALLLGAGALAGPLGPAWREAAAADCLSVGQRCKRGRECCSGVCKKGKCRAHDAGTCPRGTDFCAVEPVECSGGDSGCACVLTTGDAPFCAVRKAIIAPPCERDADCAELGQGAACVIDCAGGGSFCLPRCPTRAR